VRKKAEMDRAEGPVQHLSAPLIDASARFERFTEEKVLAGPCARCSSTHS